MAEQTGREAILYVVYTVGGNEVEIRATETNLDNESADQLIFSNDKERWLSGGNMLRACMRRASPAQSELGRLRMS